ELKSYWLTDAADEVGAEVFERFSGRMGQTHRIPTNVVIELEDAQGVTFNVDGSMEKSAISVCQKSRCKVISTRIQRGFIRAYETKGML
ncbi:MAG: hypothetical protein K8I00_05590, partial [Candidatus Omnitrophica bacterium]|nr:hypothetical protein [Candidatus Omnitrophota bacterium]